MVYRDSSKNEIIKKKGKVNFCEGEDCIDKMLYHINKKWKGDRKMIEKEEVVDMIVNCLHITLLDSIIGLLNTN